MAVTSGSSTGLPGAVGNERRQRRDERPRERLRLQPLAKAELAHDERDGRAAGGVAHLEVHIGKENRAFVAECGGRIPDARAVMPLLRR